MMENISIVWVNLTSDPQKEPLQITTDVLQQVCRQMDQQITGAAIAGLVLTLVTMFYFGRWRPKLEDLEDQEKSPAWLVPFCDKFLLTMIAMCFVIIIVRVFRAG